MKNTYRFYLAILLILIISVSGCVEQEQPPIPLNESDCPVSIPQSSQDENLVSGDALASNISAGVGKVSASVDGDSEKKIIIFEELHNSRAGQIEIAIMLNRLHDNGLKTIALEGFSTDDDLHPQWFHNLSNTSVKQEVATQLLKKGEISDAEFIALLYPDVKIYGVENAEEYNVRASEDPSFYYILAIGFTNLSQDEKRKASQLAKENVTEYIKFVINARPCTKKWYEHLTNKSRIFSIEEEISVLEQIEKAADKVGAYEERSIWDKLSELWDAIVGANIVEAKIDYQERAYFKELLKFYRTASKRSETITANTLNLSKSANAPIALVIGAGHTSKVSKLLKNNSATYAVITPNSLTETKKDISKLNSSAYDRKLKNLSVDEEGMLGSFLDRRSELKDWRKPYPFITTVAGHSEPEMDYITDLIADGAANGGKPPFGLENEFSMLEYVNVHPDSIKVIDNYLFRWDEIPGNDDGRLIEYLKQIFEIEWAKTAKIEKIDDGKTIRVSSGKNYLSLRLNDEKTKVNLEIFDGKTDEFIAKMEDGRLNIYDRDVTFSAEVLDNNKDKKIIYAQAHAAKNEEKVETVIELLEEGLGYMKDKDYLKKEKENNLKRLMNPSRDTLVRYSLDPNSINEPLI